MASEYLPEFNAMPMANSEGPAEKEMQDASTKSELSQLAYKRIKEMIKSIKHSLIVNNLNHDLIHFFCTVHTIYNDLLQIRKNYKGGDQAFFESNEILFFVYYITVVRLLNEIKNSKINDEHKKNISTVAVNILANIFDSAIYDNEMKNIKKTAIVDGLLRKVDKKILEDKALVSDEQAFNGFKAIMNPEKLSVFSKIFGQRPQPPPVDPTLASTAVPTAAPPASTATAAAPPPASTTTPAAAATPAASAALPVASAALPAVPIDLLALPVDPAIQKEAEETLKIELEKFTDRDTIINKKQNVDTTDNDVIKDIRQKINEALEEANTKYVEAFKKAYIEEYIKPKDPKIKHTKRSKDAAMKVASAVATQILKARKLIAEPRINEINTKLEDKNLQKDVKDNLRAERQILEREKNRIDIILQSEWFPPPSPQSIMTASAEADKNWKTKSKADTAIELGRIKKAISESKNISELKSTLDTYNNKSTAEVKEAENAALARIKKYVDEWNTPQNKTKRADDQKIKWDKNSIVINQSVPQDIQSNLKTANEILDFIGYHKGKYTGFNAFAVGGSRKKKRSNSKASTKKTRKH